MKLQVSKSELLVFQKGWLEALIEGFLDDSSSCYKKRHRLSIQVAVEELAKENQTSQVD